MTSGPFTSNKKLLLTFLYLTVLSLPIVTWIRNQAWEGDLTYGLIRLAGLVAFTLLVLQVGIGSLMLKLRPIFGSGIQQLHIVQGTIAFILSWLHPTLMVVGFGLNVVMGFTGFATWGKWGLFLLNLSVMAGFLRTQPWLMKHWRWVHRLNYLVLTVIYYHSWNLGTDVRTFPMVIIYYLAPVIAAIGLYTKARGWYSSNYGDRRYIQ